jgi:hypothetical protein
MRTSWSELSVLKLKVSTAMNPDTTCPWVPLGVNVTAMEPV